MSLTPATHDSHKKELKYNNLNLYNEIISKTNSNRRYFDQNDTEGNYSHQNISSGNIVNNTFAPLSDIKYNYLNSNNPYFHTNVVFKFGNNSTNKSSLSSNFKQTQSTKRSNDFKKFFDLNNNKNHNFNDCISKNESNSNYDKSIKKGINHYYNNIDGEIREFRNKNNLYKISFKSDSNTNTLVDNNSFKSDFNKIVKNKKGLKLIINSLKKDNNMQNKINIQNHNKIVNEVKKYNKNKNKINNNINIEKGKMSTSNNILNKSKTFKSNGGEYIEEIENGKKIDLKKDQLIKEKYLNIKNNKDNNRNINSQLDLKIEEYLTYNYDLKNSNNMLKSKITKYENNIKTNKKDISKLKNEIIKLTNENDTLKIVLKNSSNLKNLKTNPNRFSPKPQNSAKSNINNTDSCNSKNKNIYIMENKKNLFEKNIKKIFSIKFLNIQLKNKNIIRFIELINIISFIN
jgi:hypothetical protein